MDKNIPTILVVDDDERIRRLLSRYLERQGMQAILAEDGEQMREALKANHVDLLLLDLVMPGEDGLSLAREVRKTSQIPIIILTGRSDTVDKVVGLEVGADDYVTKPFDERELLARVRSVLRRQVVARDAGSLQLQRDNILSFGDWRLDCDAYELIDQNDQNTHLTKHEFLLLHAFVSRPNRIWTRDEILDLVAEREYTSTDRSIDVLVGKLRKKVEKDPKAPEYIHTARGVGYKFSLPA